MPVATETPARTKITSTVVKETLPSNGSQSEANSNERYKGNFWEVIGSLTDREWMGFGGAHQVRVYRANERWQNASSPVGNKLTEPFTEDTIREKWGGGRYNLWLYGPPEGVKLVMGEYHLELEGPPKTSGIAEGQASSANGSLELLVRELLTEIRQSRGGTLAADSMRQAMDLNAQALRTGVEAVRQTLVPGPTTPPQASRMESLMEKFMEAMILKAMNPPETNHFKDTLSLINEIKGAGLFGNAAKPDILATFAANLPSIADRVVAGFREFRMSAEATERTVRISRGEMRPNDPNVITVDQPPHQSAADAPPPPPRPAAAPTVPAEISPDAAFAIIVQANLQRLVQAMKDPDCTGEDICHFLSYVWPEMLVEMAATSKEHLMLLFKTPAIQMQRLGNTILSEMADDPRLPRLIDEFLIAVKKGAPEPAPADASAVAV